MYVTLVTLQIVKKQCIFTVDANEVAVVMLVS